MTLRPELYLSPSFIRLPQGVHDLLPDRASALQRQGAAIASVFGQYGYERVETPSIELAEVIERGLGRAVKDSLFRMIDPSTGEIVVLRPDFTAQVARMVVARMAERQRPLRLFYQGRVLRALDPLGRGLKSRDAFQAGAELIGAPERWADLEVLEIGARALAHLESPLTIDLGHAGVIDALSPEGVDQDALHAALAFKDAGRVREIAPALEPLIDLYGELEALPRAKAIVGRGNPRVEAALDQIERVGRELKARVPRITISFDLGEERGLGYYTGLFFHGYVDGAPDAVLLGGRYDSLLERYGRAEPAVGLAIDTGALAAIPENARGPSGVVFAEIDLEKPVFLEAAAERRQKGERAVLVQHRDAAAYARANGYRRIVQQKDSGEVIEDDVRYHADR